MPASVREAREKEMEKWSERTRRGANRLLGAGFQDLQRVVEQSPAGEPKPGLLDQVLSQEAE